MKTYNNLEEVKKDIVNGVLEVDDDVQFDFGYCIIDADIKCKNLYARNIKARYIDAGDINAWDIKALDINAQNIDSLDINAQNIKAWDIKAENIKALDIKARDIKARDINARDVDADDISYYGYCISYENIKCKSIDGRRVNSFHKCLDGKLTIKE